MLPVQPETTENFVTVPSRTKAGVSYRVYLDQDGKLQCNCPAGSYERNCYHKRSPITLKWLKTLQQQKEH